MSITNLSVANYSSEFDITWSNWGYHYLNPWTFFHSLSHCKVARVRSYWSRITFFFFFSSVKKTTFSLLLVPAGFTGNSHRRSLWGIAGVAKLLRMFAHCLRFCFSHETRANCSSPQSHLWFFFPFFWKNVSMECMSFSVFIYVNSAN